jgi:hypothetical protein
MLKSLTLGDPMATPAPAIQIDRDRFDVWQRALGRTLTQQIRDAVNAVALTPEQRKDLTADIGFRVTAILDGSGGVPNGEGEAQVVVMFAENGNSDTLLACEGESWMHEYAQGWVDDMSISEFGG